MKLKEFVEEFVLPNTPIRLWKSVKQGCAPLGEDICKSEDIVNNKGWQTKYRECEVEGVMHVLVQKKSWEAVDLLIKVEE